MMTFETEYGALGRSHDSEARFTDRRLGDLEDRVAALEQRAPIPVPVPEPEPPPFVVALRLEPATAQIDAAGSVPFRVMADFSDQTREEVTDAVAWSLPDGGRMEGHVFVPDVAGVFDVIATHANGAEARATIEVLAVPPPPPPPPPPTPPSASHPLVEVPTAAVLGQEIWSRYDKVPAGRFRYYNEPPTPYDTKGVELVQSAEFGKVIRCWQGDDGSGQAGTTGLRPTVRSGQDFSRRAERVWGVIPMRYQKGFHCQNPGGQNDAWKFVFGTLSRLWVWFNGDKLNSYIEQFGGALKFLPGHPANPYSGAVWYKVGSEWTDEKWVLYTFCEERLSPSHYRCRRWMHRMTADHKPGALLGKFGYETVGGTVPQPSASVELGINRNGPMPLGTKQWWEWGPWLFFDADVFEHPTLSRDML